jgi:peptide-methionine (S)-S-oxide reductase
VSGRAHAGSALIAALLLAHASAAAVFPKLPVPAPGQAVATFAGGCFWCMEPPFDKLDGVLSTTSGYTGGTKQDPTYEQVSAGGTGHLESVQIVYDPKRVSYEKLLEVYWHNIDPTDDLGQFCDKGGQYRSVIFVHDEAQRKLAEASRSALEASHRLPSRVVTEIRPAGDFHPAEEYHQDYYVKNPIRYKFYRTTCGRDAVLDRLWGEKR